jgi:hypothetical protein
MLGSTGISCVRAPNMIKCSNNLVCTALERSGCARNNRPGDHLRRLDRLMAPSPDELHSEHRSSGAVAINAVFAAISIASAWETLPPRTDVHGTTVLETLVSEPTIAEVLGLPADQRGFSSDSNRPHGP